MSRRRRDDPFIIEYAQQFESLPWWAGLTAAILFVAVSVVLPHLVGAAPLAAVLAMFGQWFLWLLAGATVLFTASGVVRRALDRRRFDRTTDLSRLDPYEFERYIGEYYRRRGFSVAPMGGRGPDGGVDLRISEGPNTLIVQCKHWKVPRVGPRPLRELWGVLADHEANGAVFVTSGSYTPDARAFAEGKKLELIDGPALARMVTEVKKATAGDTPSQSGVAPALATHTCPRCGSPMVIRTAHRGQHAGDRFWGCSTYPDCRQTVPLTP